MNAPTLLRPKRSTTIESEPTEVIVVRPMRAAFGPHVSLVSVDGQGRLWVRFSTAMCMLVSGLLLVLVPLVALWLAGGGLVNSGQIILDDSPSQGVVSTTADDAGAGSPTELPLAHQNTR